MLNYLATQYKSNNLISKLIALMILFSITFSYAVVEYEATTTVDFTLQTNLIVIPVQINGVPEDFIFDTGASRTTVSSTIIKELGIKEVEKMKARGVGGEVDASIARIDSIAVGEIVLYDFSCGVTDLDNICALIGTNVAGVLGYDFISQFRITIDYQARQMTFDKYKLEALASSVINGDTFTSPKFKIKLIRPDQTWQFNTETPLSMIPVIVEKTATSASVRVQGQEMFGPTLDEVITLVESAIAGRVTNYKKLSTNKLSGKAGDYYVFEYTGQKDSVDMQFKQAVFKTNEYLYNITCSVNIQEFASVVNDFESIIKSISFIQ